MKRHAGVQNLVGGLVWVYPFWVGMRIDQIKSLGELGSALWPEPERCDQAVMESIAAVNVLGLRGEEALQRGSKLLLDRAERDGVRAKAAAAASPFFRLLIEERWILSLLHRARWSYSRISSVLGEKPEKIAEIAWSARLHLAVNSGKSPVFASAMGSRATIECPDYDPRRPWMQKFIDEEFSGAEKVFLQSHLERCEVCRNALTHAKSIYFKADALVPALAPNDPQLAGLSSAAQRAFRLQNPLERTFVESLIAFFMRRDVWIPLAAMGALLLYLRAH